MLALAAEEDGRMRLLLGLGVKPDWIVRMRIALGQFPAALERRAAAHRDVRVLAYEQGLEAACLELARQLVDRNSVIGRKIERTHQHGDPPASTGTNGAAEANL